MSSKASILGCAPLGQNEIPSEAIKMASDPMEITSTAAPEATLTDVSQPAQSPTYNRSSSATFSSPSWAIAVYNKNKLRAFFHSYHFSTLKQIETSLYSASVFVICDGQGLIERVSTTKYRGHLGDHVQVRVGVLGPWEFFVSTYAPRHFYFEFHQPSLRSWSPSQTSALLLTQRLLNQKASWYAEGNDRKGSTPVREVPPPYIPMIPSVNSGSGLLSPPGQDRKIYQPSSQAESAEAQAEKIAMSNLKRLGDANIPQTSATLFIDDLGAVKHILYARPCPDQLSFVSDDEHHVTVIRVLMENQTVVLDSPFEPLNKQQRVVIKLMQHVLQEACRNHQRQQADAMEFN